MSVLAPAGALHSATRGGSAPDDLDDRLGHVHRSGLEGRGQRPARRTMADVVERALTVPTLSMRVAFAAAALLLVATGLPAQRVELPPHDWVVVAPGDDFGPQDLLAAVRDEMVEAVAASGLAAEGYPKPCLIERRPHPDREGAFLVSCVAATATVPPADGVLLDAAGHHIQLSIVDFPDSRAYLTQVFLVSELPPPDVHTEAGMTTPRVVVHHPYVDRGWHPGIWAAIERAIAGTGARPIADGSEG